MVEYTYIKFLEVLSLDYTKLYEKIDSYQADMLTTLDTLISIPSIRGEKAQNMPYGKACSDVLSKTLEIAKGMGFVTKNFENYVGTIRFNDTPENLGILCHLDVVPVTAESWSYPPFRATLHGGRVFGRGAIDDKGPAVAVLYAMKSIKDMGIKLKKNVRFIVGTDEENGSSDLEYYSKCESMPPNVFTPDGSYPCINLEKGMVRVFFNGEYRGSFIKELKGGTVVNGVPAECYAILPKAIPTTDNVTVEKVADGYRVKYTGLSAHASTPELGDNAITGLLECLKGFDTSQTIQGLADCFPHGDYYGKSLNVFKEDSISGKTTCVLSTIDLSDGTIHGKVDIRFPINTTKESVVTAVRERLLNYGYSIDIPLAENPHYTDENSNFIKTLLSIYASETGNEPYCKSIGGGTYVHNIEGGVAFGAEFPNDVNNMHGDDESIKLDSLMLNCKMFARAIVEICGIDE